MIMNTLRARRRRRGSILVPAILTITALCGFVAMAVDVGMMASVKVQAQNAADAAALAGARTLNGATTPPLALAQTNALAAAAANSAMGTNGSGTLSMVPFQASEVTVVPGTYHYDNASQAFYPSYSLGTGETYNLEQVTVTRNVHNTFYTVNDAANTSLSNVTITAISVAAHRPRDITLLFDFSGSMNNESDLWNSESYLGSLWGTANNTDPIVPAFAQYSSASASMVWTGASPGGRSNVTQPVQGTSALVDSFFISGSTGTVGNAFTQAPASYATAPNGDTPLRVSNASSGNYAQTVKDILGANPDASFDPVKSALTGVGYDYLDAARVGKNVNNIGPWSAQVAPSARNPLSTAAKLTGIGFSGFTQGPKYYGKTFFMWPPDPRSTSVDVLNPHSVPDWRARFFLMSDGVTPVTDNTVLWTAAGVWKPPYGSSSNTTGYKINYKEILYWIQNVGPNPFPASMGAGQITYYTAIPSDVPAAAYDHDQPNSNITNADQRFWKEYIDFTIGVWLDPFGNINGAGSPNNTTFQYPSQQGIPSCSYGPDFQWGTVQISAKPSASTGTYMNYLDNPPRPRHRLWFGPMTMMQYIADTGLNPGTIRDISTYSAKLGIASVINDIQINHPNDAVSMIIFNRPQYTGDPQIGTFSQAQSSLGRNYATMYNALWYPPNSSTTTYVRPWDVNGLQTPRSFADYTSNTATQHGLMLAYNQFSGNPALVASGAGGLGRIGAQRLVVLETDGMANVGDDPALGFSNNGYGQSYYNILPGQANSAIGFDQTALLQVVQAICNTSTGVAGTPNSVVANPGYPGYAVPSRPVSVQTIAFGIVFEISTSSQTNAVSLLQQISTIGGSVFPASASDPTNGFKWCIGPLATKQQLLQQAFSNVLNDGDAISIVQ
jgi:Flp pilus assembly protein TadG